MTYFTAKALAANKLLAEQMSELEYQRALFNNRQEIIVNGHRKTLNPVHMACNAVLGRDFWVEVDSAMSSQREGALGIEILNDLQDLVRTLPVGKTLYGYRNPGDIATDVSVSIDGGQPYSFDKAEGSADGDPVPVFTSGYGANWRDVEQYRGMDYSLIADSQDAKMKVHYEKLVDYTLFGDDKISVAGYQGQGLTNHRNTYKIDLGTSGANIDLTTATGANLIAFFTTGAFGQGAQSNRVAGYDVVWVSYGIWNNLRKEFTDSGVTTDAMKRIVANGVVREFRPTFKLVGNELLGYVRNRSVIQLPVGAATGITALPRDLPQSPYNFQIMTVQGVQVRQQYNGYSGVVYAKALS